MKCVTPLLFFLVANLCTFAQSEFGFSGAWELDKSRSLFAENIAFLLESQILLVDHHGSTLRIEATTKMRVSSFSNESTVALGDEITTYTTNVPYTRTEEETPSGNVRITYRASWKGTRLKLSQSKSYKLHKKFVLIRTDEEWSLSPDKERLTIKRRSKGADGEKNYLLIYTKAKKTPPKPIEIQVPKTPLKRIDAGVIDGVALKLFLPEYSGEAQLAKAQGIVKINVLVGENGEVVSAEAIEGHTALLKEAIDAAKNSRFVPRRIDGQPVKFPVTIVYNFIIE